MAESKSGKRGLGRGLTALMADVNQQETGNVATTERSVPIESIHPNPDQPRRRFAQNDLEELAGSIKEKGVLQPLIVRKNPNKSDSYEIVAGERRWRAAQIAKQHELPVIIRGYSDDEVLEIAIIENVQRADLNAVEEAAGYRQLMDRFGHTQIKMASVLSKSRSHIANLLRLLQLPDDVLELLREEKITAGHARALVTTENPSELARSIVKNGLSVRETEKLAKGRQSKPKRTTKPARKKDADTVALERDLSANLKLNVQIDHKSSDGSGSVVIRYDNVDQLDDLCQVLSSSN